jgi:LPS-assembly protein
MPIILSACWCDFITPKDSRVESFSRNRTNLNIRFLIFIASITLTYLPWAHAVEMSENTPVEKLTHQTKNGLQFEQSLKSANQSSNTPSEAEAQNVQATQNSLQRLKLRMSRSINDFEALNKALKNAEVVTELPALKEASRLADEATTSAGGIVIEGDRMQIHMGRTMSAIGNASLSKEKQTVTGDRIEYDTQNSILHVVGHAMLESPDSIAKGTELHLNIDDSRGEMKNASYLMFQPIGKAPEIMSFGSNQQHQIEDSQNGLNGTQDTLSAMTDNAVNNTLLSKANLNKQDPDAPKKASSRGTAETMFFEGENKKRFSNASFTSCEVGNDDWFIKSNEIKIDNEAKTVQASNARIVFKGVPVLYSPSVSFPYAGQRKTGFLSPLWGQTSRSGFELYTPYYVNIAPNRDATIASRLLSKRGLQAQGEVRYLEQSYSGIASFEYLANDAMTDQSRYLLSLRHQQNLGSGWAGGYQFDKVSDDNYFADMSTRITQTSRVNLPQQANISYNDDIWQLNIMAQRFQTLRNDSNPINGPYARLPQVTLNGKKDWGDFIGDIKNQIVYFDLEDKNNIGLRRPTGVRTSSYPSITLPLTKTYGYITPKIGLHYTQYNLNNLGAIENPAAISRLNTPFDENINRTLPIFSLDSGIAFERDTKVMARPYTQTLEPRLFYVYIPYRDQSLFPNFDSALADLNIATLFAENQFVGVDRMNNANQVTLALSSKMIDKESGQQRFAATIAQRFYFADQRVGLGYPGEVFRTELKSDVVAAATAKLRNKWNIDTALQYNTDTSSIFRANVTARFNPEPGKVLNLTYRYLENIIDPSQRLDQINVSTQWPLGRGLYALGRLNYSIKDSQIIEGLAGLEYDAGCWQSRVVMQRLYTATAEANYAFFYQLEFGGMASVGANPFKTISRNIPGYSSPSQIPENYRQDNYE